MKPKVIVYCIGIVVIAVVIGLVWLSFKLVDRRPTLGGILLMAITFGVAWIGGKGWDVANPFIVRYKSAYVFVIACIPIVNLVIPYWVGRGLLRLMGRGGARIAQ
ncbi:MAG: hypothetical protein JXA89_24955 [Anaerolineae bacterium]|nr:hypothetical protein [Anaerolineae bacterium]